MKCNSFKEKVVDLFDKNIDMQIQMQLNEHMSNCSECKAYYDELRETFNMLQPQNNYCKTKVKTSQRFWRYAAVAAVFLLGLIIGWSHLFSTPAVAEDARSSFLVERIQSVQNVGSLQMEIYVRTTPQENFAHFDPTMPFVKTNIWLLRQNDSLFYRIEKENGRTLVSNGREQYMWVPGKLYAKGGLENNFLERFANLIFPERLLAMQESAIKLSNKNSVTQTETDTTIILTIEGTEKDGNLQQLVETGEMGLHRVIVENTFSKNDGLLRLVKLWVIKDDKKTLLFHIDNIRYNVMLNRNDITRLPAADWIGDIKESDATDSRLKQLQKETAQQAAERILNAIITGNEDQACEALIYYESELSDLKQQMKGCKVSDFKVRADSSYAGIYVFYMLTTPDGDKLRRHIAIRNDNEQNIWILDGGL